MPSNDQLLDRALEHAEVLAATYEKGPGQWLEEEFGVEDGDALLASMFTAVRERSSIELAFLSGLVMGARVLPEAAEEKPTV